MSEDIYGKENEVNEKETVTHYAFDDRRDAYKLPNENLTENNRKADILAVSENAKLYVILGWISAALTFFISPLFAIAGITFGVLLNRQIKGSGNTLIIANVVIGIFNLVLGMIYVILTEMVGY